MTRPDRGFRTAFKMCILANGLKSVESIQDERKGQTKRSIRQKFVSFISLFRRPKAEKKRLDSMRQVQSDNTFEAEKPRAPVKSAPELTDEFVKSGLSKIPYETVDNQSN